jgi:hypothetical protein
VHYLARDRQFSLISFLYSNTSEAFNDNVQRRKKKLNKLEHGRKDKLKAKEKWWEWRAETRQSFKKPNILWEQKE